MLDTALFHSSYRYSEKNSMNPARSVTGNLEQQTLLAKAEPHSLTPRLKTRVCARPIKVTDVNGRPVESANATFYVDSIAVGWSLGPANGIAKLSSPVAIGRHMWFASANKDNQGGLSDPIEFTVGELASLTIGDMDSPGFSRITSPQLGEGWQSNTLRSRRLRARKVRAAFLKRRSLAWLRYSS
jgi:hypothetical protein